MAGLGPTELVVALVIILLLFGAKSSLNWGLDGQVDSRVPQGSAEGHAADGGEADA